MKKLPFRAIIDGQEAYSSGKVSNVKRDADFELSIFNTTKKAKECNKNEK